MPQVDIEEATPEDDSERPETQEEAVDSRGVAGWNRVDQLARALLRLSGLSVTNSQAREIQRLYEDLMSFDKRPLQL